MLVLFTFGYNADITEEEAARLKPLLRGNPDVPFKTADKPHIWYGEYAGDLQLIAEACPRLIKFIELKDANLAPTAWEHIMNELREIREQSRRPGPQDRAFNEKVEVHVPGHGLLMIDEVKVERDCCTDLLQDLLDKGWRILAACPQPDQRRPDYVLGRSRMYGAVNA